MYTRTVSIKNPSNKFYFVLAVLYKLALDISYKNIISKEYAYMSFLNNRTTEYAVLSWILLCIMLLLCKKHYDNHENRLSDEIVFWLFLIAYIPFTTLVGFGVFSPLFILCNCIYWIILLAPVRIRGVNRDSRVSLLDKKVINDNHIRVITIVSFLVVLYVSGRYTGFRINLQLLNVYEFRNEARNYNLPVLLDYVFTWTRTVNAILEAYYIRRKRYGWAAACFLIQVLNYGVDGAKTTMFLAILVIIINILPSFEIKKLNRWALLGFVGITFICYLAYIWFDEILPEAIITRRVFFVPAYLQSNYFDFFASHTPDFFRQSFLRFLGFESPYPNIAYMIGDLYSHQSNMSANNGLISDAMTNLGYAGIVLMPILIRLVLRILDRASEGLDNRLYLAVALYVSIVLSNSFLFTTLLTHGLLVVILLLGTMNRDLSSLQPRRIVIRSFWGT